MELRKGMWIVWNGRVGIYTTAKKTIEATAEKPESTITVSEFHATDELGRTTVILPFAQEPGDELRQAKYDELPAARRGDRESMAVLGYV